MLKKDSKGENTSHISSIMGSGSFVNGHPSDLNEDKVMCEQAKQDEISRIIGEKGKISNIGYGGGGDSSFVKTPFEKSSNKSKSF